MFRWLGGALLVVALLAAFLGSLKDVLPEGGPKWLAYFTAAVTLILAVLQFTQDYRGWAFDASTNKLAEGVSAAPDAPAKPLSREDQRLYTELKESSKRFREAPVKLFFSPSFDARALYRLGLIAFNQRDLAEAEKNLKYALSSDPTNTDAFNLLLQLYQSEAMNRIQSGDLDSAREYLEEAQRLVVETDIEGNLRTLVFLGYAHKSLGQVYDGSGPALARQHWQEAGAIFERVLAQDPSDVSALNGLGNVLHHEGKMLAALAKHEAALAAVPNYTAAANDAALVCEALITQDPTEAEAWKSKACKYWQQALALSVQDPQFDENYRAKVSNHFAALCT